MGFDQEQNYADELVIALTPVQFAVVLAVLVSVFVATRMRRAR